MITEAHNVLAVQATLGEGPVWVGRDQALWFVDIKQQQVHRFDPMRGAHDRWAAPEQVGWVLPADDGAFLAGLRSGIHRFDPDTGGFAMLVDPEPEMPGNRLNDATVDAAGRVWFGTMDDAETASSGRLYRWDGERVGDAGLAPCPVTNGPAVSPDGATLYHTDTLARTIHAMPLCADGKLGPPRVFATIDPADGSPDGCTVDAEGHLWTGLWGGWRARRYTPAGGIADEVSFPVANVTKVAFGGPDLRTAYVTTARKGLDDAERARQPLAGNVFAFEARVAGLPGYLARTR